MRHAALVLGPGKHDKVTFFYHLTTRLDIEQEMSELFKFRLIGSLTPDGVAASGRWPYQAWWAGKARNPVGKTAIISANIHMSFEAFDVTLKCLRLGVRLDIQNQNHLNC